jgi:hypothetical protein
MDTSKMVPGFSMTSKVRPMVIGKFQEYISDQSVIIQSSRLIEEMKVFIWKNGRAEAQQGYNDDLVMSFGIGMFMRDTSYKFRQQHLDMSRATLNNISTNKVGWSGAYTANSTQNPYKQQINGKEEDISWLL